MSVPMPVTAAKPTMTATRDRPLPGAWWGLALLLAINLFNYIDRYILAAVEPEIRAELLPDDAKAEFKMGLLALAFMVVYMLSAPVFGWLADHISRWKIIALGVFVWSLASGASGIHWTTNLAAAFLILLLTRCLVGIGEGAYGPVAPTVISDYFPKSRRGFALSWFYLAIPVGSALGYAFGGLMAASALGWRWAFFLVVPPGVLLALWSLFMREPPRGCSDLGEDAVVRKASLRDYLILLRIPSYVLDTLGMTAMTFAIGGMSYWMKAFLDTRGITEVAIAGLSLPPIAFFGGLTALGGLLGTLLGGISGDLLRRRFPGSYFLVSGLAMLVAFPMILLVILVPFPLAWLFLFIAVVCLFFNTGPTNTILANVTHPAIRATGYALNILVLHALGDAVSPALLGYIVDLRFFPTDRQNWDLAFGIISALTLLGAVLWLAGTPFLARDTANAPAQLPAE